MSSLISLISLKTYLKEIQIQSHFKKQVPIWTRLRHSYVVFWWWCSKWSNILKPGRNFFQFQPHFCGTEYDPLHWKFVAELPLFVCKFLLLLYLSWSCNECKWILNCLLSKLWELIFQLSKTEGLYHPSGVCTHKHHQSNVYTQFFLKPLSTEELKSNT